ncbi:hypothetical protein MPNT_10416 [Candidatus Methylacidithermus pantelleriae]|uniref:Uncharacterized protein n=1 Tax=Candidatus Methylacidithermus pantelleriae TaxID=2744239 RepID=A0A8J2BG89_9BACT|nr:hypothetical protein MPNT_10416 [Candidatus Methylacidithermus pantelleriae]
MEKNPQAEEAEAIPGKEEGTRQAPYQGGAIGSGVKVPILSEGLAYGKSVHDRGRSQCHLCLARVT